MSVGDPADPTEAVAEFLLLRMGSKVGGRVYRPELPQPEESKLPESAIVVMPAGGLKLMGGSRMEVNDSLVDILCYGFSRLNADSLGREALKLLRLLQYAFVTCPESGGRVLLHWARIASGVNPRVHPQVNWPYTEFTAQVLHSELVLT